jgi:hypothetical protein
MTIVRKAQIIEQAEALVAHIQNLVTAVELPCKSSALLLQLDLLKETLLQAK